MSDEYSAPPLNAMSDEYSAPTCFSYLDRFACNIITGSSVAKYSLNVPRPLPEREQLESDER